MAPQGILLAAGYGRRFDPTGGLDKLLVPLADGAPVLWHGARSLATALPSSLAIVRPNQPERVRWLAKAGCRVVESSVAECGMGHALAAGVAASPGAVGWVVALADMPWLPSKAIAAVAECLMAPDSVAASQYDGRRGHPVGFGAAWRSDLLSLVGDHGARMLLRGANVTLVEWHDDRVLRDVDTPEDLLQP